MKMRMKMSYEIAILRIATIKRAKEIRLTEMKALSNYKI